MRKAIIGLGLGLGLLLSGPARGELAPVNTPAPNQASAPATPAPTGQPPAGPSQSNPSTSGQSQNAQTQNTQTPAPATAPPALDCTTPVEPANRPGNDTTFVEVSSQTAWRPRGEAVQFTLSGPGVSADNLEVAVCYRWKTVANKTSATPAPWFTAPDLRPVLQSSASGVTLASTVPAELPGADSWLKRFREKTLSETTSALGLIPLADMRIVARQKGSPQILLDVVRPVGISNRALAFFAALASVLIAWFVLLKFAERRDVPGRDPFLRLITTDGGYASLSQLQIMLWTFVVGASAVYVMVLAGNLVAISTGTLILLGISGASTVGSKIQSHNQDVARSAAPPANPTPQGGQPPQAPPPSPSQSPAPTVASRPRPDHPRPMWSDLVVAADNPREIDVTRVQMLFFTVTVALFVAMRVLSSGVIPEIPDGFLVLMGISNGVYLTSKFVPN